MILYSIATKAATMIQTKKLSTRSSHWHPRRTQRKLTNFLFLSLCFACTSLAIGALFFLGNHIVSQGYDRLSLEFINNFPSRIAAKAGIKAALFGTLYLSVLTMMIAVPIGVGAAIYLEEFMPPSKIKHAIDINIANLAGVPSIVYGMLGLMLFVRVLDLGRSLLSGALTMSLLILPIIIVATREALKTVPEGVRLAAYGLGATQWQTIKSHVLPAALPGILTGLILALSRAIGETAPLVMIGALSYMAFVPETPFDAFTALPIQIFNWAARPQEEFHVAAAAAIIVLLAVIILLNAAAIALRARFQRQNKW